MRYSVNISVGFIIGAALFCSHAVASEWTVLFNGKDIGGWEKKGGAATYKVEDACIVGTTKPNTPNTFLCTKKMYGDFILKK